MAVIDPKPAYASSGIFLDPKPAYAKKTKKQTIAGRNMDVSVPTGLAPFKGDLRPPSGILASSPVNKARAAAAAAAASTPSKGGAASQAPVGQAAAAGADASSAATAKLISDYNLARAGILKGIGPDIQNIYGAATDDLGRVVGGATEDVRNRLFQMGGNGNTSTTARGNDFVENNQGALDRIQGSYNADAIKNAAYTLGAAIPGESLAKQGAAFGAAAEFAPGAALQEGAYDLTKALAASKVANKDLGKVSAANSKLLGYVADAYGNPVLDAKGKKVVLPKQGLTPYQEASLGLRAGELKVRAGQIDYQRYKDDRSYQLQVDKANATDSRYYAGLQLRTDASRLALQKAKIDQGRIDSAASRVAGHIVLKDGSTPKQKNGQPFAVASATSKGKAPSSATLVKASQMADNFYNGVPPVTRADGTVSKKGIPPVKYQPALRRLKAIVGYTKAREILDALYQRGEGGRPLIDFETRKALLKLKGVTKATLTNLQNAWQNASTPEGKAAAEAQITALVNRAS